MIKRAQSYRVRRSVLAIVATGGVIFLVWRVPHLLLHSDLGSNGARLSPVEIAEAVNGIRTTLLQAIGGLAVLLGVAAAWRQSRFGETAHLVQTFTQTVERLGDDQVDVRTGALLALGLTAHPLNRVQIVADTICRWVRAYPTPPPHGDDPHAISQRLRSRAPDLQTALEILTRLKLPPGHYLRLFNADLRGATLRDARLRGADLRGARLQASDLRGADLRGAHLDATDLTGVDLVDADLRHAKYSIETVWDGAKIRAGWRKLPKNLDPGSVGIVQQARKDVPAAFDEKRSPEDATRGKFGG